jgi:hypothetical protein
LQFKAASLGHPPPLQLHIFLQASKTDEQDRTAANKPYARTAPTSSFHSTAYSVATHLQCSVPYSMRHMLLTTS